MKYQILRHQLEDMVGIVITPMEANVEAIGKDIATQENFRLGIREDIPTFHKIALTDMNIGDKVMEYGQVIGAATQDIQAGDYVHIHNIKTRKW